VKRIFLVLLTVAFALGGGVALAAERGDSVVIVYNSALSESKTVAKHYAAMRHVPNSRVVGFKMPKDEIISRADYEEKLEGPLRRFLEAKGLLLFEPNPASPIKDARKVTQAKIRYIVLCYGVPLRIAEEPGLTETDEEKVRKEFRRNGAAVDSELCLLPWPDPHRMLAAFQPNPCYGATNSAVIDPTNGLLMVARLDGPSAEIANGLVDKALEAERDGLWGRAYFDLRGLPKGDGLRKGDEWIGTAAIAAHHYGFETIVDQKPETFAAGFPMSQIALYAGWYDWNASGPFAQPHVEFMPGAFAYHLHSYSAQTLRSTTEHWCGPLLAKGATATMGCVDEPFLDGTPNLAFFFTRWLAGFTFGEAAYASQGPLSWQTTVVGDPLYRPFAQDARLLHESLIVRHSPMVDWSNLRVVNLSLVHGVAPAKMVQYIHEVDPMEQSTVLTEKLGDLYQKENSPALAVKSWQAALDLKPTPLQALRLREKAAAVTPEISAPAVAEAPVTPAKVAANAPPLSPRAFAEPQAFPTPDAEIPIVTGKGFWNVSAAPDTALKIRGWNYPVIVRRLVGGVETPTWITIAGTDAVATVNDDGTLHWWGFRAKRVSTDHGELPFDIQTEKVSGGGSRPVIVIEGKYKLVPVGTALASVSFKQEE